MIRIDNFNIPSKPGVYFFKTKEDKILYIWKAKDLKKRISQYFVAGSMWKQDMLSKADKIDFLIVDSESESLFLENNLIKKYQPIYNSLLKWDNSYVYIKITNEDFPQIFTTRFRDNDWATYIWPKNMSRELRKLLQILRWFLKFRWCKKAQFNQWKPCQDYVFGICKWWCVYNKLQKSKDNEKYLQQMKDIWFNLEYSFLQAKQEYKRVISILVDFFEWNSKKVEKKLLEMIQDAINTQNFERAARLRDVYLNIQNFTQKQSVEIDSKITWRFYKIKRIWEYWVYVLIYFFEWKLIDVLRFKEKVQDTDLSTIQLWFENEFWEFNIQDLWKDVYFAMQKSIKLKKSQQWDILNLMDNFIDSFVIGSFYQTENLLDQLLKSLQKRYWLSNYPYRIEAIDISHMSGSWISWGLSCMFGWILNKKWYRKYKIQLSNSDDYESLRQVIKKRLSNNIELPDLFVIDGWKWQINILKRLFDEDKKLRKMLSKIDFISIWKGKSRTRWWKLSWEVERIYRLEKDFQIKEIELQYDDTDKILIKLRDEAHRFANEYRKKQMQNDFK